MIASAPMTKPSLLIADEPTTALDATVRAQIPAILGDLKRVLGLAILSPAPRHRGLTCVHQP